MPIKLNGWFWTIPIVLAIGIFFSSIIPPFQSPDEFDHIKGAYLVPDGELLMTSRDGSSSGGMVDLGLLDYMQIFDDLIFHPERKLTAANLKQARAVRWRGETVFTEAPTAAIYSPLSYLPQAAGLHLGRLLNLPVGFSYYVARLFTLAAIAILLFLSFRTWEPSLLTLFLLALPMTAFQMSSASLDGLTAAMTVFFLSVFLNMCRRGEYPVRDFAILVVLLTLLGTSRIFTITLYLPLLYICLLARRRSYFGAAFLSMALVVAWSAAAMLNNVDTRVQLDGKYSGNLAFYLSHPLEFPRILFATLTHPDHQTFLWRSFIGNLGWLDTPLPREAYTVLGLGLLVAAAASVMSRTPAALWKPRTLLMLCGVCSFLFLFFAILVQWNVRPAAFIEGPQGRHLMISVLIFSYGLSAEKRLFESFWTKVVAVGLALIVFASLVVTANTLIARYYIAI
jgi:uncharacterized membrane protein